MDTEAAGRRYRSRCGLLFESPSTVIPQRSLAASYLCIAPARSGYDPLHFCMRGFVFALYRGTVNISTARLPYETPRGARSSG